MAPDLADLVQTFLFGGGPSHDVCMIACSSMRLAPECSRNYVKANTDIELDCK